MAIRVEPDSNIVFGVMAAQVVVTHARFQKAAANAVVRTLAANVTVAAGERLRIPSTMFDVVYKTGQLTNAHMDALVKAYWEGEVFQIDCMTSATAVVADAGYSQQTNAAWTFTQETD